MNEDMERIAWFVETWPGRLALLGVGVLFFLSVAETERRRTGTPFKEVVKQGIGCGLVSFLMFLAIFGFSQCASHPVPAPEAPSEESTSDPHYIESYQLGENYGNSEPDVLTELEAASFVQKQITVYSHRTTGRAPNWTAFRLGYFQKLRERGKLK